MRDEAYLYKGKYRKKHKKNCQFTNKLNLILVIILYINVLTSCLVAESNSEETNTKTEIVVFAAASLTECFTEIKNTYEADNEGTEIVLNFAGSQVLKNQIESGGNPAMYFSANTKYPEALVEGGINIGDYEITAEDVDIFAKNQLVIISAWDKVTDLDSFVEEIDNGSSTIILANGDVPVGKYTISFLDEMDTNYQDQYFYENFYDQVVSFENDVKAVLAKVKFKEADYGIVYGTDAIAAKESVFQIDITPEYNQVAIYGSLLLSGDEQDIKFYEYVTNGYGQEILKTFGFVID